jgi:hypothetical protein
VRENFEANGVREDGAMGVDRYEMERSEISGF